MNIAEAIARGGLAGLALAATFIFYVESFDAHHIVRCVDRPGHLTAVTRWEWAKSWVIDVHCED